ncbi:MAG: porin [Alphaproteobacteria bacterium]|nr:porin [Alphaproteobacteria bacterium]
MNTLLKSILFASFLMMPLVFTNAFDFDPAEVEETPEKAAPEKTEAEEAAPETPKKIPKKATKKTKKKKSKAVTKARTTKKAAKRRAAQVASRPASTGVHDQIRFLHNKIDQLESGNLSNAIPTASCSGNEASKDKAGYIPIQGTNTALKIGGYIKADGIYDANQFTGDATNVPNLRLKNLDSDATRSNVFTAHAKQTRISLASETNTPHGQVVAFIEGDFFGSTNFGSSAGSFNRSETSSQNSYNFRVRHAYGSFCIDKTHRVDIGQMWTLFYDTKSTGTTLEFNGPETTAQIRRPQIRYAYTGKNWRTSFSLESGATEYLDISPAFVGTAPGGVNPSLTAGSPSNTYNTSQYRRAQNSFIGGIGGDGNQALPDFVAQFQYEKKNEGHISIGLMARELNIKKLSTVGRNDPTFSKKEYGYGVAFGGRYFVDKKTNIFGQFNFGKGIGTYIFGLDGYGAALDASRGFMQTQFAYGTLIGVEFYWRDNLRTNIIGSLARATIANFITGGRAPVIGIDPTANNALVTLTTSGYSISNMLRQFYVNLLWSPAEKFEVGIEYAYLRRDTINNFYGYGNRFQFGAFYKF